MKQILCAVFLLVANNLIKADSVSHSRTKEFYRYQCCLTLPDQTWQWSDAPGDTEMLSLAVSEQGCTMILVAKHSGRDVLVNNKFIKGFEEGVLNRPNIRKIGGHKLTFQGVPCYQLDAHYDEAGCNIYNRVFSGHQTVYTMGLTIPEEIKVDSTMLDKLFASFSFISDPESAYANDMTHSTAYRMGQAAGEITFWLLLVGVIVTVFRKIRKRRVQSQ